MDKIRFRARRRSFEVLETRSVLVELSWLGAGGSDLDMSDWKGILNTQEVGIVFADGSIWILRRATPLAVVQPLLTRSRSSDSAERRWN